MIEPEKQDTGSSFHLTSKRALPAAEWVWREKHRFPKNNQELFAAQFVLGEDGDRAGADEAASQVGSAVHEAARREIIARDSVFQARLRGWFARLANPDSLTHT